MKKILSAFLLGATIFTVGCEKEKVFYETQSATSKVGLGFGTPNTDPIVLTVDATTSTLEVPINAYVNGGGSATATVVVDESLVTAYNDANGTEFEVMPSDIYTIPATIAVTGGEGLANATIDIQKLLTYGTQFAIACKITGASGGTSYVIPGNSEIVIVIKVKNAWEGDYSAKGYFFHPSSPRAIARDKFLGTIDPNTTEMELGDLGGSGYYFHFDVEGASVVNWQPVGAAPAVPASGFMTLDNPAGIGTYPGPGGFTHDIYNNTYDEAGGIFWLHYGYGVGSSSQSGFTRQTYEKLTAQ